MRTGEDDAVEIVEIENFIDIDVVRRCGIDLWVLDGERTATENLDCCASFTQSTYPLIQLYASDM